MAVGYFINLATCRECLTESAAECRPSLMYSKRESSDWRDNSSIKFCNDFSFHASWVLGTSLGLPGTMGQGWVRIAGCRGDSPNTSVGLMVGTTRGTGEGVVVVAIGGKMWTGGNRGGPSVGFSRVAVSEKCLSSSYKEKQNQSKHCRKSNNINAYGCYNL